VNAKIRYQEIEQDPSYPPYINSCIGQIQLFFKKNNVEPEKSFRSIKQVNEEYFPDSIEPQLNQEEKQ
jgi:hypothetical protein